MKKWFEQAEKLLESVDEKIKDVAATPSKGAAPPPSHSSQVHVPSADEASFLLEQMQRDAKEQKARTERLVSEMREAVAARAAAEQMLVADLESTEAEQKKIVELRSQVNAARHEVEVWKKKVDSLVEREQDMIREKDAACVRIIELQSALQGKDVELRKVLDKVSVLETRLERSRQVLEEREKQIASKQEGVSSGSVVSNATDGDVERDRLVREVEQLREALTELGEEATAAENRSAQSLRSLTGQWEAASRECEREKALRRARDAECKELERDLERERKQMVSLRKELEEMKRKRDEEESKKKQSVGGLSGAQERERDMENRLRRVTDALLAKQSALDLANAERTTLLLQVESLRKRQSESAVTLEVPNPHVSIAVASNESLNFEFFSSDRFLSAAARLDVLWSACYGRPRLRLLLILYLIVVQLVLIQFWLFRTKKPQ